ncbi:MAG TPA: STAS domain-containing protein [Planctomycetota bacterium]|nr:STAS domain-containing protein [Planctomycetota bacterium]
MTDSDDLELETSPLEDIPGAALVRISGKGGRAAVRRLQDAVQPLLAQGTTYFLFDCAKVEFFNSTALGFLINLADAARKAGGTIAFCRLRRRVELAFDLLGLKDFFEFYPDPSGFIQHLQSVARTPEPPLDPATAPDEGPPTPEAPSPVDLLIALPGWLEEADRPTSPPIDHLRWAGLLQAVVHRYGTGTLEEVCRRSGVSSEGPPSKVIRGILKNFRTPEDLLRYFDEQLFTRICGLYGISVLGGKESRISAVVSFVRESTTEKLAGAAAESAGEPFEPLELSNDNVFATLQSCPLPKLLKSERSARDQFSRQLARVFGKEKITSDRSVGRHVTTKVDLDVAGRFGLLVRMASAVFGKKPADAKKVLGLLGQVSLLAGNYGRGNLFIVLFGEIKKDQAPALGELRGWMEGVGGRFVHVR